MFTTSIKRGCSEFSLRYADYDAVAASDKSMMLYPSEWAGIESEFDKTDNKVVKGIMKKTKPTFCIDDVLVILRWLDYAKGLGDYSASFFSDLPIVNLPTFEKAKLRS